MFLQDLYSPPRNNVNVIPLPYISSSTRDPRTGVIHPRPLLLKNNMLWSSRNLQVPMKEFWDEKGVSREKETKGFSDSSGDRHCCFRDLRRLVGSAVRCRVQEGSSAVRETDRRDEHH